jgi:hypothetical protein
LVNGRLLREWWYVLGSADLSGAATKQVMRVSVTRSV